MSQHRTIINHPEHGPVTILWGWDPPLGTFFITPLNERDEYVREPVGMLRHEAPGVTDAIDRWPFDLAPIPDDFARVLLNDRAAEGDTWDQRPAALRAVLEQLQEQIERRNRAARCREETA